MLVRFYTDDQDQLKYYGELPSRCLPNMGGVIKPGQALGNIPYAALGAFREGVIDWNNDTFVGSILSPSDPRTVTAPYPHRNT